MHVSLCVTTSGLISVDRKAIVMRSSTAALLIRVIVLAVALALAPATGWAQTAPPPPPPAKAPHPPAKKHATPVVQPQGATHAQKPATKAAAQPEAPAAPVVVPPAGKPAGAEAPATEPPNVPRFQSLRSNEVNLRSGPGTRYRIDWVYKRAELPVEVEREFEHWRAIRDADGIKGWVNQATLTSRRTFIVTGGDAKLLDDPKDTAAAVAILKPGVIGRIRSCTKGSDWCRVQVAGRSGYLRRTQFWGSKPGEEVP
jgi:SH3-like domain-containing protein